MHDLLRKIVGLDGEVKRRIDARWEEFVSMQGEDESKWFSELCFCILTANTSAEMGIRVQSKLGYEGFAKLSYEELVQALKNAGSRFYNTRARYIVSAREYDGILKKTITSFNNQFKAREWLCTHIKGLGYKEASHFLRNVGYGDLAILDKHILSLLREHDMIGEFKSMSKRRYIAIEHVLRDIADKVHMPLGKLDLYLWYLKTEKVLK